MFIASKQSDVIMTVLRAAFDFHIDRFNGPNDSSPAEANTLRLEHVTILTDLLLQQDKLEEALVVIKRGQRWVQGRKEQKSWDNMDDDREYDPPGTARDGGGEDTEGSEGFALDTNLRERLALARLRLGDDEEAMVRVGD